MIAAPTAYAEPIPANGLHDGGLLSFNFGPAVLTSWKSAVFMESTLPNGGAIEPTVYNERTGYSTVSPPFTFDRYVVTVDDRNAVPVKQWLSEHLGNRLNLTPDKPAYGAFVLHFSYIMLFSTPSPPTFDLDEDGQPILFRRTKFQNTELNKSFMLGIPCIGPIFGWDEPTSARDLNQLKALIKYTGKHELSKAK
jgi:hypothetical protein